MATIAKPKPADKLLSRSDLYQSGPNPHVRRWHFDAQSIGFMSEIVPTIQDLYHGRERKLSVADIGVRTGAGTELLANCFSPHSNGKVKMDLTAIDVDDQFFRDTENPHFRFEQQDIFDEDASEYDMCICSHTIEHVPDMHGFIQRVQQLSRDFAVFACPADESQYSFLLGHERKVTKDYIRSLNPVVTRFYSSNHWLNSDAAIFVLPGTAGQPVEPRYLTAAKSYASACKSKNNEQKLRRIVREHSDHAAAHHRLGMQLGLEDGGDRYIKAAINLDPTWLTYTFDLIKMYYADEHGEIITPIGGGNAAAMVKTIERARKDVTSALLPLCVFAENLEKSNALPQAIELFEEAAALNDGDPHALYRSALLYKRLRQTEMAIERVRYGLFRWPEHTDLNWLLADLLLAKGDPEIALAPALKAAHAKRFLPRMTRTVARIYAVLGETEKQQEWQTLADDYEVH